MLNEGSSDIQPREDELIDEDMISGLKNRGINIDTSLLGPGDPLHKEYLDFLDDTDTATKL